MTSQVENVPTTVKIILVGESCVGKSTLLQRYINHAFIPNLKTTTGAECKTKRVKLNSYPDEEVSIQVWDTAGQERFQSLSKSYYRGAEGAIVVYDISSKSSFDAVGSWMSNLMEGSGRTTLEGFSVFVAGNKADLAETHRQVTESEAIQWCEEKGVSHIEVSAKNGNNVDALFKACASSSLDYRAIMSEDMKIFLKTPPVRIKNHVPGRKRNNCC